MFGNSYFGARYFGDKYFGAANDNTAVVYISGSAAGTSSVTGELTYTGKRKGGSGSQASASELQRTRALQIQIEDEDAIVMSFITAFLADQTRLHKGNIQWHH
jgi:hypothetical protein